MDLAVTLVKSVMRAFYATREILVIDALILHEALRDDDLAYLMCINTKDLHRICGKLREDRFLTVHTRSELRHGETRPRNRTWYYVNYRHTIDAIKWRVYTMDKEVQGTTQPVSEKKEFFCSLCKAEWTMMEVLDNDSPEGFRCHRCRNVLTYEADRNAGGHEQSTRLNNQLKFIRDLLQKIDAVRIPECDFDRALSKARPVIRDATHQRQETVAVDSGAARPAAVRGLTNVGPQSINVNISTSEGASEAEKEAERARKEAIAQQNALPSWMANSTVTGESFAGDAGAGSSVKQTASASKKEQRETADAGDSSMDDIFAKLKAEQLAAANAEDDEEEGEYESEDDESFEDIPPTTDVSAIGTPSAANGKSQNGTTPLQTIIKTEDPAEDSVEDDEDEDMEFEDV